MPTNDDIARLSDMLRETREDVRNIRDNHLIHIEKDINEIRTSIALIEHRLEPLEDFIHEFSRKVMTLFLGAVAASIGIPLVVDEM